MAKPGRPADYPYMMNQGGVWYARVQIPAKLRGVFGKGEFIRTTHLHDQEAAHEKAKPWIREWKAEIAAARDGRPIKSPEEIASEFLRSVGHEADFKLLSSISRVIAAHRFGLSPDDFAATAAADHHGPVEALIDLKGQEAVDEIRARTEARTPLLSMIEEWKPWLEKGAKDRPPVEPGSIYQYGMSLRAFDRSHPTTIETINPSHLQTYVDRRHEAGRGRATIQRDLTAVKSYLQFLTETHRRIKVLWPQFKEIRAPLGPKRTNLDPNAPDFVVKINGRGDITAADVPKLWAAARALGQTDCYDCIAIQAFTGTRRESVFDLHVKTVFIDDPIPWFYFHKDKTLHGERGFPIHPSLLPMIRARVAKAHENNGYLFRPGENKRHSKSARINNPMRDVFDKAGVTTKDMTTKAFRRLVSALLERAKVPETVAAKMIGHKLKTLTYGLYASALSLEEQREIMMQVINYAETPSFDDQAAD